MPELISEMAPRPAKIEREYQQSVVRDNNRHWSGDASDYVVVDIEYAQSPRASVLQFVPRAR